MRIKTDQHGVMTCEGHDRGVLYALRKRELAGEIVILEVTDTNVRYRYAYREPVQ